MLIDVPFGEAYMYNAYTRSNTPIRTTQETECSTNEDQQQRTTRHTIISVVFLLFHSEMGFCYLLKVL